MKKIAALAIIVMLTSCGELQQIANDLGGLNGQNGLPGIDNNMIGDGLRQALDFGIDKQVTKLTGKDGFYKNELVKIALPEELKKVDKTLRKVGLSSLADQGIKALNRAAEDAVKEATPVFIEAVKGINFTDAKNILTGADNAATLYLQNTTKEKLYSKFSPVISNSFGKVGADKIWKNLITKYNSLPLTKDVNPNLTDYVTQEALKGVFTMIAVEEKEIRNKTTSRTTNLLKRIFALQD